MTAAEADGAGPPPEVAWFAALCDDHYEHLGVPDPALASSWEHCRDIAVTADRDGLDSILLPSPETEVCTASTGGAWIPFLLYVPYNRWHDDARSNQIQRG